MVTAVYTAAVDEGEETAEEETFTLRLANSGTDGTYAMLEGSSMVYLISTDTGSCLASFSGEGSRLVDRSAVTDLTEQIQALFEEA